MSDCHVAEVGEDDEAREQTREAVHTHRDETVPVKVTSKTRHEGHSHRRSMELDARHMNTHNIEGGVRVHVPGIEFHNNLLS